MVLRAAPSGEGAWPDHLGRPKPTPETAGVSRVSRASRLKVPGARPGLYRLLWKVALEEASWSGRGVGVGDCPRRWVRYCYTVLFSKATVLAPAWRWRRWGRLEGLWCGPGSSTVSLRVSACPGERTGLVSKCLSGQRDKRQRGWGGAGGGDPPGPGKGNSTCKGPEAGAVSSLCV